jgi:DNA recombination protein RmuC
MEIYLLVIAFIQILILILVWIFKPTKNDELGNINNNLQTLKESLGKLESNFKEELRLNRVEISQASKENREELGKTVKDFREEVSDVLKGMGEANQKAFDKLTDKLEDKLTKLTENSEQSSKENKKTLEESIKDFSQTMVLQLDKVSNKMEEKLEKLQEQASKDATQQRETLVSAFKGFQDTFEKNVTSFNDLQKEKFSQLGENQQKLVEITEKKLEEMRVTVDEKLQKTLSERLGQSFETVGKQLQAVQEGLGEMRNLASDVGGLKKVLSNVKHRGGFGEIQLEMLLEQVLASEQYEANVKTKKGSSEAVEFAIKLPGKDEQDSNIYLPIDAKFPKDAYERLVDAYEEADPIKIEAAQKILESTVKKMAKDIHDKYLDPPFTTDFGIMFLPFEGIYAEVVRKSSLLEDLQRNYKVIVTGPSTLAAILNSLQMGFRTLALQKRSSEVWTILGAVKTEFEAFGGIMEKAQRNIKVGLGQLEDVVGKRTNAIRRKLKSVESLSIESSRLILPEIGIEEILDDENGN